MDEAGMKIEKLGFGTLAIGDRLIIGEINEGADIRLGEAIRIFDIANANFNGAKWGYISKRTNEYSLHPTIHHEAPKIEKNMVAYAMVTEKNSQFRNAHIEKRIVGDSYKFQCFPDVETAAVWIREEVEKAESN